MPHFWVMCFFLMKLTSQIREMWIDIICIIGQMIILDGWELYHFNIRGVLIVGVALLAITSLVYIFLDATRRCTTSLCSVFKTSDEWDFWRIMDRTRWPCSLATSFARSNITRLLFIGFCQRTRNGGSTYRAWRHERKNTPSMYRNDTTNVTSSNFCR